MKQHRPPVKPILVMLIVLSTGAAFVVASDWINADDTPTDDNLFNQDASLGNASGDDQEEAFSPITSDDDVSKRISGLAMAWEAAKGSPEAGVVIMEYGTYGCQFCRQVHDSGTIEKLLAYFPDDIRFVYVSWPIYHPNDELATEAVFCAQDQGVDKFWAYHDALFNLSYADYNNYDQPSDYVELSEQIGVDVDVFATCLNSGKFREPVYELATHGYELALPGTPTFFVNGVVTRANDLEATVVGLVNEQRVTDVVIEE